MPVYLREDCRRPGTLGRSNTSPPPSERRINNVYLDGQFLFKYFDGQKRRQALWCQIGQSYQICQAAARSHVMPRGKGSLVSDERRWDSGCLVLLIDHFSPPSR